MPCSETSEKEDYIMKYLFLLLLLLLSVLVACSTTSKPVIISEKETSTSIPADFTGSRPINVASSSLEFEGYAIAKTENGTFKDWQGNLIFKNGQIVGAQGVIQATSVTTGTEALDAHLRSDDFFDAANFPEIKITSTALADGMMTADVTLKGITKAITFPVTLTKNGLQADFILDTSDFAMKYVAVRKDVKITFNVVA